MICFPDYLARSHYVRKGIISSPQVTSISATILDLVLLKKKCLSNEGSQRKELPGGSGFPGREPEDGTPTDEMYADGVVLPCSWA